MAQADSVLCSRLLYHNSMIYVLKNEKGIVLVLVLWVLMLLSVIAGEFCYSMRAEVNITYNFREETEAYYIAVAGLNRAIAEMIKTSILPKKEDILEREGQEEKAFDWRINTQIPSMQFGRGHFEVRIDNESGKIDLNSADRRLLRMMVDGFDIDDKEKDVIADSILDWIDKDDLHRVNGAENSYYESLPKPYKCKNGYFDSIEELLLVRGVTGEIFYGGLKDMVTVVSSNRTPEEVGKTSTARTRRSAGRTARDIGRININAASAAVLRMLPQMSDDLVMAVIEYRKDKDFKTLNDVNTVVGPDVYAEIQPFITLRTYPYYTIRSFGRVDGGETRRGVEAMVQINKSIRKGFKIIQWLDVSEYDMPFSADQKI
ncbi:MAG: general secretion pathway protein GspK [Deltaproteobacteria bacterium]|nr:general secretion pathway protein GspK [Deltaproteobacteria bacterium]